MGIATYTASESDFSCDVTTAVRSPATALQGAAAAETSLIAVNKELEVRFLAEDLIFLNLGIPDTLH